MHIFANPGHIYLQHYRSLLLYVCFIYHHRFTQMVMSTQIAYASRTLSSAEQNYSQIEEEVFSLIYGLRKFHQYLYARSFTIITDHKPLLAIISQDTGNQL